MRVGADLPDAIRLTAGARVYTLEEGGLLGGIVGARRLLVVGVAAMHYLSETEFRVLLARGLARWSSRESWYSVQARRVELASAIMVEYLGSNWARWINPFYWLFWLFRKGFGQTLAAYLRQRELWADQMAAQAYMAADAESALKKQALYAAFWAEALEHHFTEGRTRSFQDCWGIVTEAVARYEGWEAFWQRQLGAGGELAATEPPLAERLEALAATLEMPAPGRRPPSMATAVVEG